MNSKLHSARMATKARPAIEADGHASFLSGLGTFYSLLDSSEPENSPALRFPMISRLLNSAYFQLEREMSPDDSAAPVSGRTWSQGLAAVLELAIQANLYAERCGLESNHRLIVKLWHESIAIAWYSELIARGLRVPNSTLSWQAGMLLSAAAMAEQMRLIEESPSDAASVTLGTTAVHQIEHMVVQGDLMRSLSPTWSNRVTDTIGPWASVNLAFKWCDTVREITWADRYLERVESISAPPTMEQVLSQQLARLWPQYMEIAKISWLEASHLVRQKKPHQEMDRGRVQVSR